MMRNKTVMLLRNKAASLVLSAVLLFGLCIGFGSNVLAVPNDDPVRINTPIIKTYDGNKTVDETDAADAISAAQEALKDTLEDEDAADTYEFISAKYADENVAPAIDVTLSFEKGDDTFEVISTGGVIEAKALSNPVAIFSPLLAGQGSEPDFLSTGFTGAVDGESVEITGIDSSCFEYVTDTAGTLPTFKSGGDTTIALTVTGGNTRADNYSISGIWDDIDTSSGKLVAPVSISVSPTSVTVKVSAAKANSVLAPVATVTGGDPSAYVLTTNNPEFTVGTDKKLKVGAAGLSAGTYKVKMIVNDGGFSPEATSDEITVTVEDDPVAGSPSGGGGGAAAPTADDKVIGQLNAGNAPAITLTTNGTLAAFSGNTLNAIAAGGSLPINQGLYTMLLSPELVESLNLSGADKVDITMKRTSADGADLSIGADEANGSLLLFTTDVTLSINGVEIKDFPYPITFSVDISSFDLTDEQKANLTGIRILLNGEIVQLGGYVDGNNFIFSTMKLSKYGVAISDNLIKIVTTIDSRTYTINGDEKTTDVAPMIIDSGIMVPLRFIAEALGADISWADETRTVGIALDGESLSMVIGKKSDGMDVAPTIVNGRTLVPLKYISDRLGANVIWNAKAKNIEIYR